MESFTRTFTVTTLKIPVWKQYLNTLGKKDFFSRKNYRTFTVLKLLDAQGAFKETGKYRLVVRAHNSYDLFMERK